MRTSTGRGATGTRTTTTESLQPSKPLKMTDTGRKLIKAAMDMTRAAMEEARAAARRVGGVPFPKTKAKAKEKEMVIELPVIPVLPSDATPEISPTTETPFVVQMGDTGGRSTSEELRKWSKFFLRVQKHANAKAEALQKEWQDFHEAQMRAKEETKPKFLKEREERRAKGAPVGAITEAQKKEIQEWLDAWYA